MKKIIASGAAALLVAGGLVMAATLPASATYEECVPKDAWIEVTPDIEHPAVGEPKITIENPDYVPAVEEVSHLVEHPAEYTTVHHEAEYIHHDAVFATEWKYTKHGGYGFIWVDNDTWKYIKADGSGTNSKPWFGVFYERTQHTREVEVSPAWDELVKEAWDEQVLVKEAWTEKVIDVEAQPAQGEPTIEVDNPDYVPAWTEDVPDIEHPAVTCEPEVPVKPEIPEPVVNVTYTEWQGVAVDCDNPEAEWSREKITTTTTVDFVYNEQTNEWDRVEASSEVRELEVKTVVYEGDCTVIPEPEPEPEPQPEPEPSVEPEPNPEPSETPVAVPASDDTPKALAVTGGQAVNPLIPVSGGLAILAGIGALVWRRLARI